MRIPPRGHVDQPASALIPSLISYWSITTANGNALGTTLVDTGLATEPSYLSHRIKLLSGEAAGQEREIFIHAGGGNTITVGGDFTDNAGAVTQVLAGTRYVILGIGGHQQQLNDIWNWLLAMLVLQETGGILTTDGTEQDLWIIDAPIGAIIPINVFVNLDNMQAGDTTVFRLYHRMTDGGAWVQYDYFSYTGADGGLINNNTAIVLPLIPTRFGTRVTIRRTAGGDRAYPWEPFVER